MLQGILFDMDGVLVDSEEYICKAAVAMFAEHGVDAAPDDFLPFVGAGENRYLGGVAAKHGFPIDLKRDKARTYEIYCSMIKGALDPLPGAKEFMKTCRDKGFRLALATSADRVKMEANLEEIGIPLSSFDAALNGLEVERKKPFPDIYLKAAGLIDADPSECLVVEDAQNGVKAGKAAGCRCLGITTSFTAEELDADWSAPDLAHVPAEALEW